jgi:hypothetical protein
MRCWEFHHTMQGKKFQWYWRIVNRDGTVHSESAVKFKSSVEAFEDARINGFDKDVHEWYLASPGSNPCTSIKRSA